MTDNGGKNNGIIDSVGLLQSHGVKPTANRILLVEALAHEQRPMSLMELEEQIATIDKSNIFRALTIFRTHHLVHTIEDGADVVRYELCASSHDDDDDDMHVHFYCEVCHRTCCLPEINIPRVSLPDGYEMRSINYMVKGICPSCASKAH